MATAKKAKKSAKHLRKALKLEEQKPLTKLSSPTPTDTVSLPFTKIHYTYNQQD
jgi:type VI protein secretion system component Hcp